MSLEVEVCKQEADMQGAGGELLTQHSSLSTSARSCVQREVRSWALPLWVTLLRR
ncbi:hypothetical protein I8752_07640 [Nostocaceae cyanobacterium CENA369]|uniref:Uncharacterized protein n=1 Tax=Dendronalium phyllosphericum CENA369 TaxID=1725256 RepID=A0A8J7LDB6_9NOST|nr:hypothetical protein [Dendronalium phyllosphericum CENA369]